MRSAGNFSPEWGYLAPVPSLMRTMRVVLVATAVGATAGAAVVLALVDRPAADGEVAAAARPIVTDIQTAVAPQVPVGAVPLAAAAAQPAPSAAPVVAAPAAAELPATPPAPAMTVVAAPPAVELPAPVASQTAAPAPKNSGMTETPPAVERRVAPGMAALSESQPASSATASDAIGTPPAAAEAPPSQKKPKRAGAWPAKPKPGQTLGSVFGSLFNPRANAALH